MPPFTPPIKDRTTEELLLIVGAPDEWNETALQEAQSVLILRKVDESKIKQAKHLSKQKVKLEELKRAKESYSVFDFIFEPITFIEIIFSWELKKDGYLRKAEQQRWFRKILLFLLLAILLFFIIYK
ncbi:hypothetical protein CA265_03385 [Sphingobacteriaceae bacterium GW460-11-11-14-LB5]|nr:hypothetical protein CA265_03385 [Sphingobacteriaceae bacterium GW460-11-11-14-LB5]